MKRKNVIKVKKTFSHYEVTQQDSYYFSGNGPGESLPILGVLLQCPFVRSLK